MRLAAILTILTCGMTAAMWLRLAPALGEAGLAPAFGLFAGSLLIGPIADRFSHRIALIVGLTIQTAGFWLLVLGPASHNWMLVSTAALGFGGAAAAVAANVMTATSAPGAPGSALASLNMVLPVGMLCSPVLSPATVSYAGATLATVSLTCALATPLLGASAPTPPPVPAPAAPRNSGGGRVLFLLAILMLLFGLCETATWNALVYFLGVIKVLDAPDAWRVLSYGLPIGLILGRVGAAQILANVAPLTMVRISGCAMAFATGLMLLARSPSACWIAAVCVGLSLAPALPSLLAEACSTLHRYPATAVGLVLAAAWVGLTLSSPSIIWLAARTDFPRAMLLLPAGSLLIAGIGWVAARAKA